MSESQSRFSIISDIVEKKAEVQRKILAANKAVTDKKFENERWEKDVLSTREIFKENYDKLLNDKKVEIEMLEQTLEDLDAALKAIQSISANETKSAK